MASYFNDRFLDELRERNEIVDFVSQYVTLTRKGGRYWACCPFHGEKTPSFSVNPESQMYYCFGCHAAGTVLQFAMHIMHLDFQDAVRFLAERAKLPLPEAGDREEYRASRERKERIYAANREAAMFFFERLLAPEGGEAYRYFVSRGIDESAMRRFGLGYAPGGGALKRELAEKGFMESELLAAGLLRERNGEVYEFFSGRAMFPIIDGFDRVLAFGGRTMGSGEPKYLNTAETEVFNKRYNLYCANLLRREHGLKRTILVEGYMDAISLRLLGMAGVAATLGTAVGAEQAKMLKRFAPEVAVAYDGDSPGRKAALRALDVLEAESCEARVLVFPDGMDPDDYAKKGLPAMEQLLDSSQPGTVFRLICAAEGFDLASQEGRMKYALAGSGILARVDNPVEREAYLSRLQVETGFSMEALREQLQKSVNAAKSMKKEPVLHNYPPIRNNNVGNLDQRKGFRGGEENLLCALVFAGGEAPNYMARMDAPFVSEDLAKLYDRIAAALKEGTSLTPAAVTAWDEQDGGSGLARAFARNMEIGNLSEFFRDNLNVLYNERVDRAIEDKKRALSDAATPPADRARLAAEIQTLNAGKKRRYR